MSMFCSRPLAIFGGNSKSCFINFIISDGEVSCPECRTLTKIPESGLMTSFIALRVAESARLHKIREKTATSVLAFHSEVSRMSQQMNKKIRKLQSITESMDWMSVKSLEIH